MCSGKTTVAKFLRDKYNFKILSFGEPVKRYATEIFGLKNKNRAIIQDFAQKVREIDDEVWIKYLIRIYKEYNYENIVVDDIRFPKERDALEQEGFILIKLDIDDDFQKERIETTYRENSQIHIDRINNVSESYIDELSCNYIYKINNVSQKDINNFIEKILALDEI